MITTPYLSVVVPAYNEAERIGRTIDSLSDYFSRVPYTYEIIVVDDGSTDATSEVARNSAGSLPIKLIKLDRNRGKGFAVKTGMLHASGQIRLFMDADNSVDISHLDEFLPYLTERYDVVIGSIELDEASINEGAGKHRRILGSLSKLLIRMLAVPGIRDTQRGFKLFTDQAADAIFVHQTIDRFGFDIEILAIAICYGLRIKELPVVWDNPSGSKVTLKSYLCTLKELAHITCNRICGVYRRATLPVEVLN